MALQVLHPNRSVHFSQSSEFAELMYYRFTAVNPSIPGSQSSDNREMHDDLSNLMISTSNSSNPATKRTFTTNRSLPRDRPGDLNHLCQAEHPSGRQTIPNGTRDRESGNPRQGPGSLNRHALNVGSAHDRQSASRPG